MACSQACYTIRNKSTIPVSEASFSDVSEGFLKCGTTHGLSSIHRGQKLKKIAWVFFSTGGIAVFLLNFTAITRLYASYNVDTRTEFLYKRQLQFPSVTVCNINPMKSSAVSSSPRLNALLKKWGVKVDNKRKRKRRENENKQTDTKAYKKVKNIKNKKSGDKKQQLINTIDSTLHISREEKNETSPSNKYSRSVIGPRFSVNDKPNKRHRRFGLFAPTGDLCKGVTIDDGCYWLPTPLQVIYRTGQQLCDGEDAILPSPDTQDKLRSIAGVASTVVPPGSYFILGLKYVQALNTFVWTNKKNVSWTLWADGFPKDEAENICVMCTTSKPYEWKNVKCETETGYVICQKEKKELTTATTTIVTESEPTSTPSLTLTPTTTKTTTKKSSTSTSSPLNYTSTINRRTSFPTTTFPTFQATFKQIPGEGTAFPERKQLRENFIFENQVLEFLANSPYDLKKSLGYTFEEFILDCRFNGKDCLDLKFATFFDARHGNCYVFNSQWLNDSTDSFTTFRPGRSHGLELVINIGQDEYIPKLIDGAGAVVVVHPSSVMPFPEDEGVYAMPGQVTSVGITQVNVNRLAGNYGNCIKERYNKAKNVFEEEQKVGYSYNACFKTCYQYHAIKVCGCADPQYPFTGKAFDDLANDSLLACDSQNVTQEDCVYNITLQYNRDELECQCGNSCTDVLFKNAISSTEWPPHVKESDILQKYSQALGMSDPAAPKYLNLKENLLKIEVYFNELNFKSISEKPKYSAYRYMSDFGAILGLYLGMSMISIFEFLEFVLDLLIIGCYRKLQKIGRRNKVEPQKRVRKQIDLSNVTKPDYMSTRKVNSVSPAPLLIPPLQTENTRPMSIDGRSIVSSRLRLTPISLNELDAMTPVELGISSTSFNDTLFGPLRNGNKKM